MVTTCIPNTLYIFNMGTWASPCYAAYNVDKMFLLHINMKKQKILLLVPLK